MTKHNIPGSIPDRLFEQGVHDEDLLICEVCGKTEIDDLLNGGSELLKISLDSTGMLWVCEQCKSE